MSIKRKRLAALITVSSLALVGVHLIWPNLKVDASTLTLLVVAVLPWLWPFVKSVGVPGGVKVELQDIKDAAAARRPR